MFNTVYRGFTKYREQTRKDKDCINQRIEIKQSNTNLDQLSCTKLNCKIDESWIIELEEGLRHICSAIGQERQFILTNGDVVPIEKVRKVSRASIVHLAKHSDLITKLPEEGQILTPDKIYMEEKLSDYTVYENRFLYTLLTYVEQFVNMRYSTIQEVINTYKGTAYLIKEVESKTRNLSFELKFNEDRFDVLNTLIPKETFDLIERIDMISREITSLMKTPLMKECSKVALVKPPIVKTNVLKNNKDFKGAIALYDFINEFKDDGYVIEEVTESFNPFSNEIADEYAEIVSLVSLLTYKHSNHMGTTLRQAYEKEEEALLAKKQQELQDKIDKLKNKINEEGISLEEYIIMLETRNTALVKENLEIVTYKKEISDLQENVVELNKIIDDNELSIKNLVESNEQKDNEILLYKQKYEEELTEKETIKNQFNLDLENAISNTKNELNNEFNEKKLEMTNSFNEEKNQMNQTAFELAEENKEKFATKEEEIKNLQDELTKVKQDKNFLAAQLLAMRIKNNMSAEVDDYTSKERFKELEEQYFIFESFFSEEWKRTKKKIRKQYLSKNK